MLRTPGVAGTLTVLAATCLGLAAYAQQSQAPAGPEHAVKAAAEEVLLDVVVRDKKGHVVNNLKPEDFQIFDNGEAKKISSFRLVEGQEAVGASGGRTPLDVQSQIRLLTLIFQFRSAGARQLAEETTPGAARGSVLKAPGDARKNLWTGSDAQARRLAQEAALDLLKQNLPPNAYLAVMAIDHKLQVLQPYTNDPGLLRKAIDRATISQVSDFSADTERVRKELEPLARPHPAGAADPEASARAVLAGLLLQALNTEQSNAMMESGRAEIFALLDAVKEQHRLPGRKTVLYFSEGFTVPQGYEPAFNNLLSTANRANVSFYVVDAQGLGTSSANQAGIDQLRAAAQSSQSQQANRGDRAVSSDEANLFDTTVQSTRSNYQITLANLAESTGGFLIANTNDLRSPIRRLAEDVQTYYEISYAPGISNYDGSFHKIAVKMASGNLRVQARSGYNALPPSLGAAGSVLSPFEIPLLAALDSPQPPKAFDYAATAMHFRGRQGEPVCELVMDIPLAAVSLEKQAKGESSGRLSYLALLKDGQGEVVKKFQNERAFNVPADKLEGFKASHFIYTEHFELPPGPYMVETAVRDGGGNRISARKSSLTMPPAATTLALSSVTFVRSTRDRDASSQETDPLVVGEKVVSPSVNPVISKEGMEALPFYMVIYPNKSALEAPQLTMEFIRDGQVLGRGPAQLGQPDKDGRIQFVATVPLARLEPGNFTLRFVVKQGAETAEEMASFVLK